MYWLKVNSSMSDSVFSAKKALQRNRLLSDIGCLVQKKMILAFVLMGMTS